MPLFQKANSRIAQTAAEDISLCTIDFFFEYKVDVRWVSLLYVDQTRENVVILTP